MSDLVFQFMALSNGQRFFVTAALIILGFATGMYLRRNSKAEILRAPYFCLFALGFLAVRTLAFAWLFMNAAVAADRVWMIGVVLFGGLFCFGLYSAVIARARAMNIDGAPGKAWLAIVPLANFYLLFAAPSDFGRTSRVPAPVLVILAFVLIAGGNLAQMRANEAIERDSLSGLTLEGLAQRTKLEIRAMGIEDYLKVAARNVPRMQVDSETRISDVIAEGETLTYVYVVTEAVAKSGAMIEPMLLKANCANPVTLALLDGGATLVHQYDGPGGVEVAHVTITARDCTT